LLKTTQQGGSVPKAPQPVSPEQQAHFKLPKVLEEHPEYSQRQLPSAFSFQPSAFSLQPSAFSLQLSAFSYQPSAFSLQLSAFSYQPTENCQLKTEN
jgi:hypothetical protein